MKELAGAGPGTIGLIAPDSGPSIGPYEPYAIGDRPPRAKREAPH